MRHRTLATLRREAAQAANGRGHRLTWRQFPNRGARQIAEGVCKCGEWVQVDTWPDPNGIDIGGPAVAVNCRLNGHNGNQ